MSKSTLAASAYFLLTGLASVLRIINNESSFDPLLNYVNLLYIPVGLTLILRLKTPAIGIAILSLMIVRDLV